MPTCRFCGKETTQADAAYCTYCGSSLQSSNAYPPAAFGAPPPPTSYPTSHGTETATLYEKTLRRVEQLTSILVLLSVAAVLLVLL